jgi:hypothetical protein
MPGLLVGMDIDADNSNNFVWSEAQCECRFYRKWRLPYRHLFHHHFVNEGQTLTEVHLMQWSLLWEENGFELYEVDESYTAPNLPLKEDGIDSYDRVAAREVTETLLTSFYELERAAHQQLGGLEGRNFITWWIGKLRSAASSLQTLDFDAWKAKK